MVIPQSTKNTRGQKRFYWDLVLNNYTDDDCEAVKHVFEIICDAYIIGLEVGSKNGLKHLQCCLKLKKGNYKTYILNSFKTHTTGLNLDKRVSLREGRNIEAMKDYCMKDGVIYSQKCVETIKKKKKFILEDWIYETYIKPGEMLRKELDWIQNRIREMRNEI
jgi:hypothetical protein